MMEKIKVIVEGWKNAIIPDDEIEQLAKERLEVCNQCEFKKKMLGLEVCGLCNCPLVSKTRTVENTCPKNKWKK